MSAGVFSDCVRLARASSDRDFSDRLRFARASSARGFSDRPVSARILPARRRPSRVIPSREDGEGSRTSTSTVAGGTAATESVDDCCPATPPPRDLNGRGPSPSPRLRMTGSRAQRSAAVSRVRLTAPDSCTRRSPPGSGHFDFRVIVSAASSSPRIIVISAASSSPAASRAFCLRPVPARLAGKCSAVIRYRRGTPRDSIRRS